MKVRTDMKNENTILNRSNSTPLDHIPQAGEMLSTDHFEEDLVMVAQMAQAAKMYGEFLV